MYKFNLSEDRDYLGNCIDEELVENIFGSVSCFTELVEEFGNNFTFDNIIIEYDEDKNVHHFYEFLDL